MKRLLFRTLNRLHITLYRLSGGRILGNVVGSPILLLTTIGRKTGQPRTVPLVCARDGAQLVVIASDQPAWHTNLRATATASINVRGQDFTVTARDASETESDHLWSIILAQSPAFRAPHENAPENHRLVLLSPLIERRLSRFPHPQHDIRQHQHVDHPRD